ncbi:MAG: hypothetical protein GIW99_01145 [Candidatus Eremiobacteraeota bacterium]|nr:hypothetical protein [Candidatus Eremiobacteraeota bacterium]MBC5826293.1 hypothetical protein [Candidatus Eremiobacteraeota bacterium]
MIARNGRAFGALTSAAAVVFGALALFCAHPALALSSHGGDIVAFGHSVTVAQGQEVAGDLVVFGGNASVYGKVDGDAVVMGGTLYVDPQAEIAGDTVAFGGAVDDRRAGHGRHRGTEESPIPPVPPVPPVAEQPSSPAVDEGGPAHGWLWFLVSSALLTTLAFVFFPLRTRMALDDLAQRPLVAGLIGFFWPVIFTVVIVALAITIVGIPLMPVAAIAVGLAYLLGRAAIAVFVGRRIFEVAKVVEPSPLSTLLLGLVSITVIEASVPLWLGIVLEGALGALAIGAAALTVLRKRFIPLGPPIAYAPAHSPSQPRGQTFAPPPGPPPTGPPAVP